jgi:hypothetical protein
VTIAAPCPLESTVKIPNEFGPTPCVNAALVWLL